MRQLGSKLLAGGLSAGVVLLWWPMFFPTDSVTAWLGRGIVWTLSFELLLVALSPFEAALWSTRRGERISRRVESKRHLLDHESPKRRLGRRAGLALTALALPLALIGVGVSEHIPAGHAAAPKVTKVTRVVRVVKPVRVERVVRIKTVSAQVPAATAYPSPAAQVPDVAKTPSDSGSPEHAATQKPAAAPVKPQAHANVPPSSQSAPTTQTGDSSGSTGSQTVQQPAKQTSGATAQPTT